MPFEIAPFAIWWFAISWIVFFLVALLFIVVAARFATRAVLDEIRKDRSRRGPLA